ncbi:zinc-binding alcohol dehydrogenase family protein [Exilibacterium tricleocarpae]|uniref:Zinc-type alcohol dehydrogenase-like protein n=1 Tax=Exilibacterium tricleocarpae TaxID=2591008 RepID=A0A545T5V7_9GAMM|nr:zinc-binding alcohol dehydrogenase family protein [Exilibacterium tricleocarpae]TQV72599.1 zinc-binding alcohol dehydrogenase family protein [Exilibacterium tricleocarpae]
MKAVGYKESLPITDANTLVDFELPQPVVGGYDMLVRIDAIAVNPVDYKVRQTMPPAGGAYRILGWDASGEVVAAGNQVSQFQPGDKVFYAGDITLPGSNAEYQRVDARLAGHRPRSLSAAEAAALPLAAITAWEILFDHLKLSRVNGNRDGAPTLLVTGAAGGVGSMLVQLARRLTNATVVATASRPQSRDWVTALGAHHVIDHHGDMVAQLRALGIDQVNHVASLNGTGRHFATLVEVLKPFGSLVLIDDPVELDIGKLKSKSLSLHWEFMFARSMHRADDMQTQGELLSRIALLVDDGLIKTTLGQNLGTINAANLRRAHTLLEAGDTIGKIVLEGFD